MKNLNTFFHKNLKFFDADVTKKELSEGLITLSRSNMDSQGQYRLTLIETILVGIETIKIERIIFDIENQVTYTSFSENSNDFKIIK